MTDKDDYAKYDVPGHGGILPDGTYWNFVSEQEASQIRQQGMINENGRKCLDIRAVGDKFIAQWQKR